MSRFRNFASAALSSYFVIGTNIVYTLVAIPLVLSYLGKSEYGLWVVILQISGYLLMIDLGMSSSVGRLLIDYKDQIRGKEYVTTWVCGMILFFIQAGLVLFLGTVLSFILPDVMSIDGSEKETFQRVFALQAIILGLNFSLKGFNAALSAHQRMDIANISQIISLAVNLVVLWICLERGHGIISYIYAGLIAWFVSTAFVTIQAMKLGIIPSLLIWQMPGRKKFFEVISYGGELFFITAGAQLILTGQIFVIARSLGPEAAAIWAVMTKPFTMVSQLLWRLIGSAMPAFAEIIVQKDFERLSNRYKDFFVFILSGAWIVAAYFATCNSPFIYLWTGGEVFWSQLNNWALALWLVVLTLQCFCISLLMALKTIGVLKWAYFVEAAAVVAIGLPVAQMYGLSGMILTSLLSTAFISFSCGIGILYKTRRPLCESVFISGILHSFKVAAPISLVAWLLVETTSGLDLLLQLIIAIVVLGTFGMFLMWNFGMSQYTKDKAWWMLNALIRKMRKVGADE